MVQPASPVRGDFVRRARGVALASLVLSSSSLLAASSKNVEPPALTREHKHPSGAFTFRTPETWTVETAKDDPDAVVASGDSLILRFVHRDGESGLDSLHGACMVERLAPQMEVQPNVQYEYDYVGGVVLKQKALDSAFVVKYDKPIQGQTTWRQRNVTLVGGGHSVCVVTNAPLSVWKKSGPTRRLADAVMASLTLH
jgi:hypothetical protein